MMPAEYLACVKSEQSAGKPHDKAQAICAAAYYKKHGKTVQEAAHEESKKAMDSPGALNVPTVSVEPLMKFYSAIVKIDKERQMVFGYATTDSLDSQGEIVDLDASFEAAEEFAKWGSINEMHDPKTAAGVAMVVEKHTGIGVYVGAKIVDPVAWAKCEAGVYRGYSIEGKALRRHSENPKRITKYIWNKLSLVDRPSNPDSLFMVAKRDENESDINASGQGAGLGEQMENQGETPAASMPPAAAPAAAEVQKAAGQTETPASAPVAPATPSPDFAKKFEEMEAAFNAKMLKMETENSELKKQQDELVKRANTKDEIIKAMSEISPVMKKALESANAPQKSAQEKEWEMLKGKSLGELTGMMLKSAPTTQAQ